MKTLILALVVLFFGSVASAADITLAAAANLQFAIKDLAAMYEDESGHHVKVVLASSGKLTSQLENGAPFDVFLSADTKYPQRLFEKGLTVSEPKVYAYGTLVLWTTIGLDLSKGITDVLVWVKSLAIADPQSAPYGREAIKVLEALGSMDAIKDKLVFGDSISQTDQFIMTRSVDAGITARSVVESEKAKGVGEWVAIDLELYDPIAQAGVILKNASDPGAARDIFEFLFSHQARLVWERYGYTLP